MRGPAWFHGDPHRSVLWVAKTALRVHLEGHLPKPVRLTSKAKPGGELDKLASMFILPQVRKRINDIVS